MLDDEEKERTGAVSDEIGVEKLPRKQSSRGLGRGNVKGRPGKHLVSLTKRQNPKGAIWGSSCGQEP